MPTSGGQHYLNRITEVLAALTVVVVSELGLLLQPLIRKRADKERAAAHRLLDPLPALGRETEYVLALEHAVPRRAISVHEAVRLLVLELDHEEVVSLETLLLIVCEPVGVELLEAVVCAADAGVYLARVQRRDALPRPEGDLALLAHLARDHEP